MAQLNQNSGLTITYDINDTGSAYYIPCQTELNFNTSVKNNYLYWNSELFHLYQDQYYNGLLSKLSNYSLTTGGSNIEAEEKLITILGSLLMNIGYGNYPSFDIPSQWLYEFMKNHSIGTSVTSLTEVEVKSWYQMVEDYRNYWLTQSKDVQHLNAEMVDYSLLPNAFLSIWNKLNCK
jgi:hypothetical protein